MNCNCMIVQETIEFQGFKDLSKEATGRYKFWTFGDDNTITLGCLKARTEDEGEYKVIILQYLQQRQAERNVV